MTKMSLFFILTAFLIQSCLKSFTVDVQQFPSNTGPFPLAAEQKNANKLIIAKHNCLLKFALLVCF